MKPLLNGKKLGGGLLWVFGAWPLQAHVLAMSAACSTFAGGWAALLALSALRRAGLAKSAWRRYLCSRQLLAAWFHRGRILQS